MTHDDIVRIFKKHGIPMAPDDDPYYKNTSYTVTFVPAKPQVTVDPPQPPHKRANPRRKRKGARSGR